jgi:CRP/FNR family transcriptional regulator, cyclic AMP receptor protein
MSSTATAIREPRTVARIPLFASLSEDEVRALDARCLWRKVPAGEWVIDYQAEDVDVFFVLSGHARAVIHSAGREMIMRDMMEGEYFGQYSAIDGKPRSAAIVAVADTVVARMSAPLFWEVIHRYPGVREDVLKTLVSDARRLNQRANEQANFDVRHRLCAELLRLSRTTGEGRTVVSPPPTHAELAGRISTHREAVTKILNTLERNGLIARSHTAIVLVDAAGLRRIVAELT